MASTLSIARPAPRAEHRPPVRAGLFRRIRLTLGLALVGAVCASHDRAVAASSTPSAPATNPPTTTPPAHNPSAHTNPRYAPRERNASSGSKQMGAAAGGELAILTAKIIVTLLARAIDGLGSANGNRGVDDPLPSGPVIYLNASNPAALNHRSNLENLSGDYDAALADAARALAIDPANLMAYLNRGDAEIGKLDYEQAIAAYQMALALQPDNPAALSRLSDVYVSKGDYPAALFVLSHAIELAHDDDGRASFYDDRANVKLSADDLAGAMADLGHALQLKPQNVEYLVDRGSGRLALDDPAGADRDFAAALQLEPQNSDALYWRGMERKMQGDVKGALADWDQSIAADPANSNRTRLYRALGMAQSGQPTPEFPQEVTAWEDGPLKMMGLFVVGRADETSLLTAVGPGAGPLGQNAQSQAYYCIGEMRMIHGDPTGAKAFWQKAIDAGPRSASARELAQAELARLAPTH